MRSREDIESYLTRAEVPFEEVGDDGLWLLHDSGLGENIAIKATDSLLPVLLAAIRASSSVRIKSGSAAPVPPCTPPS